MFSSAFFKIFIFLFFLLFISFLFSRLFPNLFKKIISLFPSHKPIDSKTDIYISRKKLLSPAELSFYKVLEKTVPSEYIIIPKVRQADVLSIKKGTPSNTWQSAFNKISRKHYDFVLCSKKDFSILGIIELDDNSHNTSKTISRDNFVDKSLSNASIPVFHFRAKHNYSFDYINKKMDKFLLNHKNFKAA